MSEKEIHVEQRKGSNHIDTGNFLAGFKAASDVISVLLILIHALLE